MNWLLLKNSLLIGGATALLSALFGLVAAIWLLGVERKLQPVFLGLALAALALPPFVATNCWLHYLGHTGAWRDWFPLELFSPAGTILVLTLLLWPIPLLAVWSAWQRLEPAQLECDPAVRGAALLRALLLPLARPALLQAAILTLVLALNNFAVPAILQVKVFPAEMWVRFSTDFNTTQALLLSWPLVLGPLLLLVLLGRREVPWPHLHSPVSPSLVRHQLGPVWHVVSGLVTATLLLASVGLPLLQLASAARTWTELPGAFAAGVDALFNSVFFAGAAATLIVAVSLLAWTAGPSGSHPGSLRGRLFGWGLWFLFLVPGVLLGIGLIAVFNRPALNLVYQSAAIVVVAFTLRYLAFGWNTVWHAGGRTDPALTDAARVDGAGRWATFRHVYWPQVSHPVAAAWYVVFLLCLWDCESIVLIVPPGGETLALRIFNLLHYGHNAQVNALCLVLLGAALAPLLLWHLARLAMVTAFTRRAVFAGVAAAAALALSGCGSGGPPDQSAISSQLFSRVQIISARGAGIGQVNKPRSVAVDAADNLFVVDMTGRVQKFSSNGVFQTQWQMPQTDIGKPKGMCRDRQGNIVIIEPHYARVNHFSPAGELVRQWGSFGTAPGMLGYPRAVAVNSHHEIFVSEYSATERVQQFELNGSGPPRFLKGFGRMGTAPGEFNRPEGLCVDAQDRLYVADSCNHRIQVFNPDGTFLRAYGQAGRGLGQLSYPYDICVDSRGMQYVCEFGNSRVQVFGPDDRPVEIIGGPGREPGQFSNPWGVALDGSENLYVADSQNHRIQKLIRRRNVAQVESGRGGGSHPLHAAKSGGNSRS